LQCAGYVSRSYEHQPTGGMVNMVLIVGPPGPTSVHIPDVCYASRDYRQQGPRESVRVESEDGTQAGQFWSLTMRPNDLTAVPLRSYYAWSAGDEWVAAENPRLTFGGESLLYKVQLAASITGDGKADTSDPGKLFLKSFLASGFWPLASEP
jgi:hypothetical protein